MISALVLMSAASPVFANHGPGTSGGGSATASGETLKQGHFELSLREDYTQFENVSTFPSSATVQNTPSGWCM